MAAATNPNIKRIIDLPLRSGIESAAIISRLCDSANRMQRRLPTATGRQRGRRAGSGHAGAVLGGAGGRLAAAAGPAATSTADLGAGRCRPQRATARPPAGRARGPRGPAARARRFRAALGAAGRTLALTCALFSNRPIHTTTKRRPKPPLQCETDGRIYAAAVASSSALRSCTGPESRPLASTSRSTNSITATAALSP